MCPGLIGFVRLHLPWILSLGLFGVVGLLRPVVVGLLRLVALSIWL